MARSTFKVLFYVNGSKEKDGIVPIMGRVTINGTVAQFSCKQTIPKTFGMRKATEPKARVPKHGTSILHWTTSRRKSSSTISAYPTERHT